MLTDIEEKIVEILDAGITGVHRVSVDEAHSARALNVPVVDVIVGGGAFARVAQHYKLTAQVYAIVTFQHLRSVADRRKGVYPILEAIIGLLAGNTLGLAISALVPRRLDNITEEREAQEGKIVFQLEFETSFTAAAQTEEELKDLLAIGLNYYLQDPADDKKADAADEVSLEE